MPTNWVSLYGWQFGDLATFKSQMTGQEITRTDAADSIKGTAGHDLIRTRGGNDWLAAEDGNDWVDGGQGADTLHGGPGHDFVQGGDGADKLYGDRGNDILDGGAAGDYLAGRDGDDWLFGWIGNDTVEGDAGHDTLDGSHGDDVMRGGSGDDVLVADVGDDKLYGGDGQNRFIGGSYLYTGVGWNELENLPMFSLDENESGNDEYHINGSNDFVWDDGPDNTSDMLIYYGDGSVSVRGFGGSSHYIIPDPEWIYRRYLGKSDKIVLNEVSVDGEAVSNFSEFISMIRAGKIGYQFVKKEDGGTEVRSPGGGYLGTWDVGDIMLDFGPSASGLPRILKLDATSLSGTDGIESFSPDDWIIQADEDDEAPAGGDAVLMLHRPSGELVAWDPDRGSQGFKALATFAPAETSVLATGDFNGDGKADFFLQQKSGQNLWWDPAKGAQGFTLTNGHAGAVVAATGQFRGSGADDLLLFNEVSRELFVHDVAGGSVSLLMPLTSVTRLIGTGNIDGRGGDDLVFLNESTGAVYAYTGDAWRDLLSLAPGAGWSLAGIGNVVGDGADDMMFRNAQSSATLVWDVGRGTSGFRDFAMLTQDWTVRAFEDLTGDGLDDLLVQHSGGNAVYWNGTGWVSLGGTLAGVELVGVGVLA